MRRLVAVLTASVMLALAATALAAVLPKSGWHFKGALGSKTAPIKFGKFRDPVAFSISGKKVKNFKFGTSLVCSGGFGGPPPSSNPFTKKNARIASMAIKKSGNAYKFSGSTHGTGAGGTAVSFTVTGTFAASGKKANGTIAFTCSNGSIGAFTYSAKKSKQ